MTIQELKEKKLIIFECISGSRAFGLDTPESDTDIKGVFVLPKEQFYGLEYIGQVSNEINDIVYYELGRFFELLLKNNPNILELLHTPEDCILYKHDLMNLINPALFLSKLCEQTFGNYALTQVKKARGLNKKIVNPVAREKKSVLDFCFVSFESGSLPLREYLKMNNLTQEECGLSAVPHMQGIYGLYYGASGGYKGIALKETANEVSFSSIPKGESPKALLYFNKDGYSRYCKDYKAYWEWVASRNESRYQGNLAHGKNYDAKNMMHVIRLLTMAEEIGREGKVNVRRTDRDYLLKIKRGEFSYEALLELVENKRADLHDIYEKSDLQEFPDSEKAIALLVQMRTAFYCR